jgi:hypothetical protein
MSIKKYCEHGFCKGIKDCNDFLPINGSQLCVYSALVSPNVKIHDLEDKIEKAMWSGDFVSVKKYRDQISALKTEERHSKDQCDLAVNLFDGKGREDE